MHCGEKVEEWQGGKIAICHIEPQFNLIQLNFIVSMRQDGATCWVESVSSSMVFKIDVINE